MKKPVIHLILLLCLLCTPFAVAGQDQPTSPTGTTYSISGKVLTQDTPNPFREVTVILITGDTRRRMITDETGSYSFSGLPNGKYTVIARKNFYRFEPRKRSVTINGTDLKEQNFKGWYRHRARTPYR